MSDHGRSIDQVAVSMEFLGLASSPGGCFGQTVDRHLVLEISAGYHGRGRSKYAATPVCAPTETNAAALGLLRPDQRSLQGAASDGYLIFVH